MTGIAKKVCPAAVPADAFCFVFRRHDLLLKSIGEASELPRIDEVALLNSTSPEECVRREVGEEVGLEITNIRYFGSQSWPFPNSLMIGFTAEHAGGDIVIDNREILDADWF